jgi:hypothetical protein
MHVAASPTEPRPEAKAIRGKWHGVFVFLLAADVVVLFIYLLLLPKDNWESLDGRLKAIGALAASIITYLGLKTVLEKRAANAWELIDSTAFRGVLLFITLILWPSILPVWSYPVVFSPPQASPPEMKIGGKVRRAPYMAQKKQQEGEPRTVELDGLLLRNYDLEVEGSKETYFLPAISILKGTLLHRPIEVQLPCTVQLPIVPGATVFYRRYGAEVKDVKEAKDGKEVKDINYGPLSDDGKIFLMPGHYDYVRIETTAQAGSAALEVRCSAQDATPNDLTSINMQPK